MTYAFLKILSWLICLLPFSLAVTLGRALAHFAWLFVSGRRKKLARENIQKCLGVDAQTAAEIAKASAINFGNIFIEVLRFPELKRTMKSHVKIVGLEHLQNYIASSNGRGGVIMTSHSDNWELMGGAFAQYGIPLVGVAKKQKSDGADKFINEFRTNIGMHITYHSGVREMYQLLDGGRFIGLIMDQDVGRHDGVIVKFFNRATNYVTGAASMSRFKGVPIFPAFMHRNPDGTHTLEVQPPLYVERTKDKRTDIWEMTQKLAALTEEHIRRYPREWFWLHDRWKSIRNEFSPEEIAELNRQLGLN
ncbi:MAG: lysophospholipid acyltransferase family protein [Selenomonadaceae bacterium]|nr:lysophospholipid acyltransferase family protein [Selenomonadaceae bacterium]